jgi:hypothetical protein
MGRFCEIVLLDLGDLVYISINNLDLNSSRVFLG